MKAYLDFAATTPVDPRVIKAMAPYWSDKFGNPSSVHLWGQEGRRAVEEARGQVAKHLGCSPNEVYFTGTTTTSDNLAILGVARAARRAGQGNHFITSAVEHHAVLDACLALKKEGFKLTILPVDKYGMVDLKNVAKAIRKTTVLVTIMYANNEVGTIQPIEKIARIVRKKGSLIHTDKPKYGAVFHTDAAAVTDYLDLDVKKLGVDLLTLGAHKFGGPKGVGALYVRKGVPIEPLTFGGHHERSLWPGTEAVPLIVGMAKAMAIASAEKKKAVVRVTRLRDRLIKRILKDIPNSQLTGHPIKRLPDIASFCFKGVEGESILLALSDKGIGASSGSACTSGILKPSHVLTAMGISPAVAHGSVRFSLGKKTTEKEIDYVIKTMPEIVKKLRKMTPKF